MLTARYGLHGDYNIVGVIPQITNGVIACPNQTDTLDPSIAPRAVPKPGVLL